MAVKLWYIPKGKRKFGLLYTFVGHTDLVTCVDICSEYSMIASGSQDGSVCLWDYRCKRLLRILDTSEGSLLSVSIGHINGHIVTLTSKELRCYCINGELVSCFRFDCGRLSADMAMPAIAIAVPSGDWQNGVVAVTGHVDGQFFLWKISTGRKRKFVVCISPTKIHRAEISSLRLLSTVPYIKARDIVTKSFAESRSMDLFVGDVDGFVSRWSPQKLDQFQSSELLNVLN